MKVYLCMHNVWDYEGSPKLDAIFTNKADADAMVALCTVDEVHKMFGVNTEHQMAWVNEVDVNSEFGKVLKFIWRIEGSSFKAAEDKYDYHEIIVTTPDFVSDVNIEDGYVTVRSAVSREHGLQLAREALAQNMQAVVG